MDRQKLAALLRQSQLPDTEQVKAATADLQKNFYPHPQSLLLLLETVCLDDDAGVRQLAAVQASRHVNKHWPKIDAGAKGSVREHLVQAVMKEQSPKCRHSESRLIANIASIDFAKGEWKELFEGIFQLSESQDVNQREVGTYLLYSAVESDPRHFNEHLPQLFKTLEKCIQDQQSLEVRVNSLMAIGSALMLIDTEDEEDADKVEKVQSLVPSMAAVLRSAVEAGDDEKIKQSFEVLQSFLAYDSSLLGNYLKDLLEFTATIAANQEASEDARTQSLAFLAQAVRYRRMKLMGMGDLVKALVEQALQILTELDDDDDDDTTPARLSLTLIAQLSGDLPPRLVMVPILEQFVKMSSSPDPAQRRAGVIALGISCEGAPDFVNSHFKQILPIVISLLNDADIEVRHAALVGLTRLAEEMSEDVAAEHVPLIQALLKNLQAAENSSTDEVSKKKNTNIIRSVCGAFDAMCDGIKPEVMKSFGPELLEPIGKLLSHDDARVKVAAAGAVGAIATAMEDEFGPFFQKTMAALGPYMIAKETEEDLTLRGGISDAIGRIATAVGPETFKPYVQDLMHSTEESLHLDSFELRESTFILWSQLAKVYELDFAPFLDGVFKALLESLELDEEEVTLDLTEEDQAIVGDAKELITAGKRVKIRAPEDHDDDGLMEDSDDEDAFEDFLDSAAAMEKEVAIEVLGDIIAHSCGTTEISKYLEKTLEAIAPLVSHGYEGCRKACVSTLWRAYGRVWQLTEEETGVKWEPGFPPKQTVSVTIQKLGEIVATSTLSLWGEESDRDVVTEINRMVALILKSCGPAILVGQDTLSQVITALTSIMTRSHPCQLDLGDEEEENNVEESSEYDWLVIDTALDVVISLALSLGPAFQELWKIFDQPIMKFASSNDSTERSTAVGVIAECIRHMGSTVTPHTERLLKLLTHRLSDEDPETKSNAAYGVGQLVLQSTAADKYLPSLPAILAKVEPMLYAQSQDNRILDNACGCLSRLMMKHPDRIPIAEHLPNMVAKLPLTDDKDGFEENTPIYKCIYTLYEHNEPTVMSLTPQLIPVFEKVLSPPEDQLTPESRVLVQKIVQQLYQANPALFQGNQDVLALAHAV